MKNKISTPNKDALVKELSTGTIFRFLASPEAFYIRTTSGVVRLNDGLNVSGSELTSWSSHVEIVKTITITSD
jgi:hypothetical protein